MFRPDKNDPFKIRRILALWTVLYSYLYPHFVFAYVVFWNLPADIAQASFVYVGGLGGGAIGAYLFAAYKNGNSETKRTPP